MISKQLSKITERKDLALTMASKVSWKPSVNNMCNKTWKSFYVLKRNTSSLADKNTKPNAYVGFEKLVIDFKQKKILILRPFFGTFFDYVSILKLNV